MRYLRRHFEIASFYYKIDGFILDKHNRCCKGHLGAPGLQQACRLQRMAGKDPPVAEEDGNSKKALEGVINIVTNLTGIAGRSLSPSAMTGTRFRWPHRSIGSHFSSTMNVWNNHEPSGSSSTLTEVSNRKKSLAGSSFDKVANF